MAQKLSPLPDPVSAWIQPDGKPTIGFSLAMKNFTQGNIGPLIEATDDADAARKGVSIHQWYESGGVMKIRKS